MSVHLLQVKQPRMYVLHLSEEGGGKNFGHDTGDGTLGTDFSLKVGARRGCAERRLQWVVEAVNPAASDLTDSRFDSLENYY